MHAYRLCGEEQVGNITLADAMSHGQQCITRNRPIPLTVVFSGCAGYFNEETYQDLTVYAYDNDSGCNGDLDYRFLLINSTSTDYSKPLVS